MPEKLKPSLPNVAWVAGLLEGEGSFHVARTNTRKDGLRYAYPRIACHMTDKDTIDRLHSVTGVGTVFPRTPGKLSKKPSWNWAVQKNADAVRWMRWVYPFMSERRQAQIETVLSEYETCKEQINA